VPHFIFRFPIPHVSVTTTKSNILPWMSLTQEIMESFGNIAQASIS
jgi:hypothetical protein